MLQTNTLDILNLLNWLTEKKDDFVFFNVSTDKAANPVNVLGASKQMMENLIFSYNAKYNAHICFISSRFANVAVSDGSLFYSYLNRFNNVDPLPVPSNTKRFFISLEEAGTICLLSAFCGENGQIYIPKLTAEADLQSLESIAEKIIKKFGFEPEKIYNEFDAVKNISELLKIKKYPLLVTKLDTMGEKDFEEFENMDETPENCSFKLLKKIKFIDRKINIFQVIENIINFDFPRQEKIVENNYLMELINLGTYNFRHNNSSFKLDDRR
jgi:nucleoside-diphosphate-sugar epimerase